MSDESPAGVMPPDPDDSPAIPSPPRGAGEAADPFAELRRSCPVSTPSPGVHLAVRHADVAAVLADDEHFSGASPRTLEGKKREEDLTLQEIEGPRHHRIRKIWLAALRRDAIAAAEPAVRELCRERVARLPPSGRADLVAELARPATRKAFEHLIGIPEADRDRVHEWILDQREDESGSPAALKGRASEPSRAALNRWIAQEARRRHALPEPPDDIFTRLLRATYDGGLTEAEFAAQVRFLCRAGTGSTVRLIANALYELVRVPGRYAQLRADRDLVPVAIDESLRHDSPGVFTARTCVKGTRLGGVRIEPGEEVILPLASANRDETVFPDPERFELRRGRVPDQLAFGRGRHRCPGAPLARMIAANVVDVLLDRIVEIRLAPGFVYESEDFSARGPRHLSVEFAFDASNPARAVGCS
jgi:cytochrome P450